MLSSSGIWQLTGGGLWELGSCADGRRLDEDVDGMGRPGKEEQGLKVSNEGNEQRHRKIYVYVTFSKQEMKILQLWVTIIKVAQSLKKMLCQMYNLLIL